MTRRTITRRHFDVPPHYEVPWHEWLGWGVRDAHFDRCSFSGSLAHRPSLSHASLAHRPTIENVHLTRCSAEDRVGLQGFVLIDVLIDSVKSPRLQFTACAMRHVTFAGILPLLWIVPPGPGGSGHEHLATNADFDAHTDWSIDLSGVRLRDAHIRGADPSRYVLDPTRQAFVTRETLAPAADELRALAAEPGRSLARGILGDVIASGTLSGPTFVFNTHGSKQDDADREVFEFLHANGLVVPSLTRADIGWDGAVTD